jgi:hypothetical protein
MSPTFMSWAFLLKLVPKWGGGGGGGGGTGTFFLAKLGINFFESSHKNSTHREKEKKGDQRGFLT